MRTTCRGRSDTEKDGKEGTKGEVQIATESDGRRASEGRSGRIDYVSLPVSFSVSARLFTIFTHGGQGGCHVLGQGTNKQFGVGGSGPLSRRVVFSFSSQ